jgi:cobalamin biosynthesis protein CbiD
MKLAALLAQKRRDILHRWFFLIAGEYPKDVSHFLRFEKDRFANPVGYAISTGIETLFDEVTGDADPGKMISALNDIIRIRAVQDFSPSRAIGFVLLLKQAVREELTADVEGFSPGDTGETGEELIQLESKIDNLNSIASDVYARCREEIDRIKIREAKSRRSVTDRLTRVKAKGEE